MSTHNNIDSALQTVKHGADALSAGAIVASLTGYLPPMAAFLGIRWYILQIYGWFEKRVNKRKGYKRRETDKVVK